MEKQAEASKKVALKKEHLKRKNKEHIPLFPKKYKELVSSLEWGRDLSFNFKIPDINHWTLREKFRTSVSWHIPTKSLLYLLKKYSPIVSIGSGFGYTESLAKKIGVDIIATDICPGSKNKWCRDGKMFTDIERLTAIQAVKKYNNRNVFMAWPPYADQMAYKVAKHLKKGKIIIYVGESRGGCTADDMFFSYVYEKFDEIDIKEMIPSWWGIHDKIKVFVKK